MQEFNHILDWVPTHARVLDLGCGEGQLLTFLMEQKNILGYGLEIDADCLTACLEKGVNVIEQNFDLGLSNFGTNTFELVMLTATLNVARRPDQLVQEMVRIGKQALISFPNFSHWRHRFTLMWDGKMPLPSTMPYLWYNTPNIHLCTIRDFEQLCVDQGVKIVQRIIQGSPNLLVSLQPNLWGRQATYLLEKT